MSKTTSSGGSVADRDSFTVLPPLSEKQVQCLRFILDYFVEHKFYPTQREVAAAMKIKSTTADSYLVPLRQKGYLRRKTKRQRRNIRLTTLALQKLQLDAEAHEETPARQG